MEQHSNWNTVGGLLVEYQTETVLCWLVATILPTIMSQGGWVLKVPDQQMLDNRYHHYLGSLSSSLINAIIIIIWKIYIIIIITICLLCDSQSSSSSSETFVDLMRWPNLDFSAFRFPHGDKSSVQGFQSCVFKFCSFQSASSKVSSLF